ncbi:MAG: endonuclease/exonuclease/phosphatase family protein [Candidatus Hydrogenedentes bacterium]|nr:endonuclease/exonuclease/phosphatase family protein [Candidatus Hydrogenedentota bacterium]
MGEDWPKADDTGCGWQWVVADRIKLFVIASALVTVLGALGNLHWGLELLSHFVAWYALGTSVLVIALWGLGARRWAIGATLLLLFQAMQPLGWYWPAESVETTDGAHCRVLLANVLTSNTDTQALLDLIAELDPDVICVQEVNEAWAKALEALHADYPSHHVVPRGDNFGIALYSRVSPSPPETLFQETLHIPALAVPLEINGIKARLLTLHALPPLRSELAAQRSRQLDAARAWYEAQEEPALIVGDLNMTMYSPVYRSWLSGIDIKNARAGHGPLGSWPEWIPFLRLPLDQCLVSTEIDVVDCRLGPSIGSDHLPLVIDIRLPR